LQSLEISGKLAHMSNRNRRKSGKNRRPQTPKVGNEGYMRGMQELRRSSAAGSHGSAKDYQRKPKHKGKEWD
jgi:hypothetical protein